MDNNFKDINDIKNKPYDLDKLKFNMYKNDSLKNGDFYSTKPGYINLPQNSAVTVIPLEYKRRYSNLNFKWFGKFICSKLNEHKNKSMLRIYFDIDSRVKYLSGIILVRMQINEKTLQVYPLTVDYMHKFLDDIIETLKCVNNHCSLITSNINIAQVWSNPPRNVDKNLYKICKGRFSVYIDIKINYKNMLYMFNDIIYWADKNNNFNIALSHYNNDNIDKGNINTVPITYYKENKITSYYSDHYFMSPKIYDKFNLDKYIKGMLQKKQKKLLIGVSNNNKIIMGVTINNMKNNNMKNNNIIRTFRNCNYTPIFDRNEFNELSVYNKKLYYIEYINIKNKKTKGVYEDKYLIKIYIKYPCYCYPLNHIFILNKITGTQELMLDNNYAHKGHVDFIVYNNSITIYNYTINKYKIILNNHLNNLDIVNSIIDYVEYINYDMDFEDMNFDNNIEEKNKIDYEDIPLYIICKNKKTHNSLLIYLLLTSRYQIVLEIMDFYKYNILKLFQNRFTNNKVYEITELEYIHYLSAHSGYVREKLKKNGRYVSCILETMSIIKKIQKKLYILVTQIRDKNIGICSEYKNLFIEEDYFSYK